ncbi:hypothetical protein Tco_1345224 [Tanacetum coccineum]
MNQPIHSTHETIIQHWTFILLITLIGNPFSTGNLVDRYFTSAVTKTQKDFCQEEGLDFEDPSPWLLVLEAIRIFIAMRQQKMTVIKWCDNCIFNGELKEEVYAPRHGYDTLVEFLLGSMDSQGVMLHPHFLVSGHQRSKLARSILSIEAEYHVMLVAFPCQNPLWMRSYIIDYGFAYNRILCTVDNKSAIALCFATTFSTRYDVLDTMADAEHAPAMAPPVRTDEQILPRIRWVPIGKSNCYLNEEKSQPSPIFKIAVDILKQTNFFRAFTASSTIPAIYIQQFWDTICFDSKAGSYKCQLDEQWFDLTQDTLRDALQITPVDKNRAFSPPPTPDTLIEFVNELGYPRETKSPSAPDIDYAERMWEEFTQSIHNFTEDKRNLAQQAQGKKKATIILIPSIRFTKLIIFHLQRLHNFHPRPESPLHLPTEEPVLGNLKFSAKGTKREVFGMTIPNELINDVIRGADYYDAYLEKVAKHQRYLTGKEVSDPDSPAPKPTKPEKKRKPVSESSEASPIAKHAKAGKMVKKRTFKSSKQW